MRVLVHGGAGGVPTEPRERQHTVDAAAQAGTSAETPMAAVVAAVNTLEADPAFNAGRGGTIQTDGRYRTDAGLMTSDRSVGAVCNVPNVVHPIDLARAVMTETPHGLLGPEGARQLAAEIGVDTEADLSTERTTTRFAEADVPESFGDQLAYVRERFGTGGDGVHAFDTVGAVATDGADLAAATSTGGRWLALAGRIGDVPQVGCGFYCSDRAAVSTTGAGEDIARMTLAREVERRIADGADPEGAAIGAIADLEAETDGRAGVIAITAGGAIGTAFNSTRMQTAVAGE